MGERMAFLLFETFPHKYSIIRLVFLLGKGEEGKTNKKPEKQKRNQERKDSQSWVHCLS